MASLSLEKLRGVLPEWSWRAVRDGFGWSYEGQRGDRRVWFRRSAVYLGGDEFVTRWVNWTHGGTFSAWYVHESLRLASEPQQAREVG